MTFTVHRMRVGVGDTAQGMSCRDREGAKGTGPKCEGGSAINPLPPYVTHPPHPPEGGYRLGRRGMFLPRLCHPHQYL
ncbi:hypothetical protein FKM82_028321 [Ascaphus truei]